MERILEDAIRNKAATPYSVNKGVRNEITNATQTAKKIGDNAFVGPLRLAPVNYSIAYAEYLD